MRFFGRVPAAPAPASTRQLAMFEDDVQLWANPEATLDIFRMLGIGLRGAPARGIAVDLTLSGGAPLWANGGGAPQSVQIQYQRGSAGPFATLKTVPIRDSRGYFDVRVTFKSSGSVRLAWSHESGTPPVYSRVQKLTVR